MRILLLTATYSPSINGVAICSTLQKAELEKRGHEVYVIAPKHPHQQPEKNVIRLPSLPNPKEPDYPILLPIPNKELLAKLPKQIDLVYFQHPFLISEMAFLAARYYKCPTVFYYHTQHEAYAQYYLPKFIPRLLLNNYIRRHLKKVISKTSHTLVGSPTFAKILKRMKVKAPYSILPITRPVPKLNPQPQKIVLCVTRVSAEKNLNTLLNLWGKAQTADWKLVIVGDGPAKTVLTQQVAKKSLANVVFSGRVTHQQVWSYYQKASFFVFPSKTDVQPGVIFEAMFAGLPIVAFNAPGPKDFCIHKQNSLLANNNRQFQEYLQQLLDNPRLRTKMGKASRQLSNRYRFSSLITQLEQLLESLQNKTFTMASQ